MASNLTLKGKRRPILPELEGITTNEWSEVYMTGNEAAFRVLGDRGAAFDVVQDAYLALCSTHRYNPERHGSFRTHFLNLVRIGCRNHATYQAREEQACEAMHQQDKSTVAYEQASGSPEADDHRP